MRIVVLDRNTLGMDIDTSIFSRLGELQQHNSDTPEHVAEFIREADVVVFNKTKFNSQLIDSAPNLKLLCVTATGYDNIDVAYAASKGIAVANVKGYSTPAVAQHTITMALYLLEKICYYDDYVKSGKYSSSGSFCNFDEIYWELEGKTWGIIGMGNIGRNVAAVATAFGCRVIYYSTTGQNNQDDYTRVDWDTLLGESDVISIHCPLTENTRHLIDEAALACMKKNAILINVARGPIVDEKALAEALLNNTIAAAGLDVLSAEPMSRDNPLAAIKDSRKLLITPHMAWASVEARTRCVNEVYKNIEAFLHGEQRNRVDIYSK